MDKETIDKLTKLLETHGSKYYCVYDWELTEEEQNKFRNAEIGDEIHIDTPMVPVVIDDEDGYFIGMYSDEEKITEDFIKEKTVQLETLDSLLVDCKASATVLKEGVSLVLNPYSENDFDCTFSMEEVDELYFEIIRRAEK